MSRQLLRVLSGQIKVGHPLPFAVRDETGKLLLARGQMVENGWQLDQLMSRGLYADVEDVKAAHAGHGGDDRQRAAATLFDLWEQAIWRLDRLLKSVAEPGFPQRCGELAQQLQQLIERDTDIAIYIAVRQDGRRLQHYGLTHTLHCALLCHLLATRLGWPEARAATLVQAALTMNLAVVELQGRIAVQGRMTAEQKEQMHAHPERGAALLAEAGVSDAEWLQAVREHHEHTGGGGYPSGMAAPCEAAVLLRMTDVFMAKISAREGRPALPVQEAARHLFAESQGDARAATLIKELGIYPPGDFVKLQSGELAVVLRRGAKANAPLVAAITDRTGMPTVQTNRRDTTQPGLAVAGPARDKNLVLRVPAERLYGLVH